MNIIRVVMSHVVKVSVIFQCYIFPVEQIIIIT